MYISSMAYLTPLTDDERRIIIESLGDDFDIGWASQCIIEIAAVLSGNKLAALIEPLSADEHKIFNDAIITYNIPARSVKVFGSKTMIVIGSMKSADIIQQEYDRVLNLIKSNGLIKPDDRFHRLIGMALGYPIDKIEDFINRTHVRNNIKEYLSDSERNIIENAKEKCNDSNCKRRLYEENTKLIDYCLLLTSGRISNEEWNHLKSNIITNICEIVNNNLSQETFGRYEILSNMTKNAKRKKNGAGILYICPDKHSILLILRSDRVSYPNMWSIPGGTLEELEDSFYAAKRECVEELGIFMSGELVESVIYNDKELRYETFIIELSEKQADKLSESISLNWESLDAKWFDIDQLPSNLHFGVKHIKKYLKM